MAKMNDRQRDQFNQQLRANPEYRAFLSSMGVNPDQAIKLSGQQRSRAEDWVRQRFEIPGNLQIDPAGNVNTDHGLSTAWSNPYFRYPLIAGGAIATAGAINPALLGLGGTSGGAAGGVLPSAAIPGMHAAAPTAIGSASGIGAAGAASAAGGAGMSAWEQILGYGRKVFDNKDLIGAAGNMLGAGSQASAQNRGAAIEAALAQENLRQQAQRDYLQGLQTQFSSEMQRAGEVRSAEGDAWRKLQQAAYVSGAPASFSLNLAGPYSRGIAGPSAEERTAGTGLRDEMTSRLSSLPGQYSLPNAIPAPQAPTPFTVPEDLSRPSAWERISGYAGAGLQGYSALDRLRNRQGNQ
jgi:hypothetical protein